MLEVAYVSKIMSKNFRKEGQPEKERIANITGMDLDKVRMDIKTVSGQGFAHTRVHTHTHTHTHTGTRVV